MSVESRQSGGTAATYSPLAIARHTTLTTDYRVFMDIRFVLLAATTALSLASAVNAQPAARGGPPPQPDWTLTIGAAPVYSPVFQGSKDYGLSVFPDLRVNYKDVFFASVPDGIGYNLINKTSNNANWKVGPLVKVRFGREEDTGGSPFLISGETNGLRGMGTVDTAGELGGFAQYSSANTRTRVELRQGFGGHEGVVGEVSLSYVDRVGRLSYSIGPRLSFGSSDFMHTYCGINRQQSVSTGLAQYEADGGVNSWGIGGSAVLPLGNVMALTLFTGFDRIGKQAADSPLIRQRGDQNQFSIGLGFGYRFGWNN